ncbi:hypothetical protein [Gottfriedia solisilvae]|uniref:Uncharacterized protein n=1 Tax=Gottfriedia solisilvae TaxID=1516104 RepID=A0A8J3AJ57_9BACI|nr:hypothetical protein [Gottfriedia solisilvae]GGI11592.1 hypothetical protein GCM10007380_08610 [Gottfriedia solisilvae]
MDLKWYLFEHSYLTGINIDPVGCSLTLHIDAKITYDHPNGRESNEANFEEITIRFVGVQYLRMVNSLNLLTNPNDDLGSIEEFELKRTNSQSSSLDVVEKKIMISNSKKLSFLNFVSELITFEIGFEKYIVLLRE